MIERPSVPPYAEHGEGDHAQHGGGASTVATARKLRGELSLPEGLLWQRLRRRAGGVKFRRQHPLGPYVLDFYCPVAKLAVEIDGAAHDVGNRPRRDELRAHYIVSRGLQLLRIAAADVLRDPDAAADAILRAALPLHPSPAASGPPPHASHGEELASGTA
jgi:very-short-patch-repair endonuclease